MAEGIGFISRRLPAFSAVLPAVLLPLCLCATDLPEREWDYIELDDEHAAIERANKSHRKSAIPTETSGDLEVPGTLKLRGLKVVSIGKMAFYGCTNLTSVTIPEGVTNIAEEAFYGCSSLTNVVFPPTLKSIGARAFVECPKLKKVHAEVSRLTIDERAFRCCNGLEIVHFNGDEFVVGASAFSGCGGLQDVDFSAKRVVLAERVFSNDSGSGYCVTLTNVSVVATGGIEIGAFAFYKCTALQTSALIAGEGMRIGVSAFNGCTKLQQASVVAPKTATFGDSVFSDCSLLQTVELPVGLVSVPTNAFSRCSSLQSVSLSSNVTSIANQAFDACTALRTIGLSDGLRTIEDEAFYECRALERLRIPQSVERLGNWAFNECDMLGEVEFCGLNTNLYAASSVMIGEWCFFKDVALTNVILSERVESLGTRAFADCEALARINLPTGLVDIAESLFEGCTSLPGVDFPVTLKTIGKAAFNSCTNLTGFLIPTNNTVAIGTKAFVKTKYWNDWPDNTLVTNRIYILGFKGNPTEVTLPDGCRSITSGMFEGMTALTNVVIPASLETVGSRAFAGSGLVQISFSGTQLTTLGISAFDGCSNLVQCTLSETLTAIPDEAFQNCTSLQTMDIPASVASIGASAFRNCTSLLTVTGGEGVRSVGDFAFAGCVGLRPFRFVKDVSYGEHVFQFVRWTENVLLPNVGTLAQEYPDAYTGIVSIVISSSQTNITEGACAGCTALEWVKIPDGVKGIGARAFEGCSALTNLVLSASVSSVGSNAVAGCSALASLTTSGQLVFRNAFPELAGRFRRMRFATGTVSLCDNVLSGCTTLTEVEIPSTVETIGAYAFAGCTGLKTGITIPAKVGEIGDYAFQDCSGLNIVRYMGIRPAANPNIYSGTKGTLVSGVRKLYKDSWLGGSEMNEASQTLPKRWPFPESDADSRRLAWWNGPSDGEAFAGQLSFYYYDATGNWQKMSPEDGLLEKPVREGYRFLGWFTKPYGGAKVTEFNYAILGVTEVYAHWVSEDGPEKWADVVYETGRTHVYDGYLLDGNANVAGTIRIRLSRKKASAKLRVLGEGKPFSMKGEVRAVSETGGSGLLKKGSLEAEIGFSPNAVTGVVDGLTIVGARNVFGEKTDWDKRMARAALDDCGDRRSVVLRADGDSPLARGYAGLSVAFSKKGKCKVSGALPDGTKVKVTAQLLVFEDRYVLPVAVPLYAGKRGGIGFSIVCPKFGDEGVGIPYVEGLSSWVANPACGDGFVAQLTGIGVGEVGDVAMPSTFGMTNFWAISGVTVDQALLPVRVEITKSGKKWKLPKADKVTFDGNAGAYAVLSGHGNPAGLKLSYAAKTGAFKGSFKVYAVTESGEAKKLSAKVAGVVLDGRGYGSAVIKKAGAVPVVVEAR